MAGFGPRVVPCPLEVRGAALEVLYRRVPAVLRDRLIIEVLDEAQRGEIDLSGLWVVRERTGRITGASDDAALGWQGRGGVGSGGQAVVAPGSAGRRRWSRQPWPT